MRNNILNKLFLMIVCGCIGITSCATSATTEQVTPTSQATPRQLSTMTATKTVTPIPTSSPPTSTLTPTPVPSPTETSSPSPTSTPPASLTPMPTIPPQQRGQAYYDLMSSNGGCELPCWWGFEMGETSLDEVRQFYISFFDASIYERTGHNGLSALEAHFVDPQIENGNRVQHIFIAQDNAIINALVNTDAPNYQLIPLLQRLGQPSDIWMWTIPERLQGILPVRIRLYFPERGVFVHYATDGMEVGDTINICFDGPEGAELLLWDPDVWDPDGTKSIFDRSDEGGSAFVLEGHPIEEVSNWNVEQFYTILTDPNHTECLETPSDIWPSPW